MSSPTTLCLVSDSKDFSYVFLLKSYSFIFNSILSYFVAWEVKFRLRFGFLLMMFNRSGTMYRKGNISSLEFYRTLVKNQLRVFSLSVYGFLILVHWSICLFLHQYHTIKINTKKNPWWTKYQNCRWRRIRNSAVLSHTRAWGKRKINNSDPSGDFQSSLWTTVHLQVC